jgi:hypothetical protein
MANRSGKRPGRPDTEPSTVGEVDDTAQLNRREAAWQARSLIAYGRSLLARDPQDEAGPTSAYARQLDAAETRIADDPEDARAQAETVLDAIERMALPHGRAVDMVDVFVAHWRSYVTARQGRGSIDTGPYHNALIVRWMDEDVPDADGTPQITTCLLACGDNYPFALPSRLQRRGTDERTPWPEWRARWWPRPEAAAPVLHYLALYVRGETLCWDASPDVPLAGGTPDVRILITPPADWHRLGSPAPDDEMEGAETLDTPRLPARPAARQMASLRDRNSLSIGSSTLLPYTFRAIRTPELWTRPGNGRAPYYEEESETSAESERIKVILHPTDGRSPLTPEQEAASYAAVLRLDDDKIRAFAICLGAWFAGTSGGDLRLGKVTLTANAILEYQGIKRWKGSYTTAQKNKVADDVWALNQIFIRGPQVVYDARGRQRVVNVRSRLLEVAQEDEATLFNEEVPRAFRVAPGDWVKPLIDEGTRYVATLLAPVLRYNPQQGVGKIAMRLGIHLALHWRFRAAHGNYEQPWYIRTLLEGTGIPIPAHREQRRRLMEQFDQALDKLQGDGVIAGWQYVRCAETEDPHRVFPEWIARTVTIAPPPSVLEQYADLAQRRQRELLAAKRRKH